MSNDCAVILSNKSVKMKSAKIYICKRIDRYWASIRPYIYSDKLPVFFCYDTDYFKTIYEAEGEARAFCRWKKLKIRKIVREYKKEKKELRWEYQHQTSLVIYQEVK